MVESNNVALFADAISLIRFQDRNVSGSNVSQNNGLIL